MIIIVINLAAWKGSLVFNSHLTHSQTILKKLSLKSSIKWFYLHSDPIIYLHGYSNWILLFFLLLLPIFHKKINRVKIENENWINLLHFEINKRETSNHFSNSLYLFVYCLEGVWLMKKYFWREMLDFTGCWGCREILLFMIRSGKKIVFSTKIFGIKIAFSNEVSASKVRSRKKIWPKSLYSNKVSTLNVRSVINFRFKDIFSYCHTSWPSSFSKKLIIYQRKIQFVRAKVLGRLKTY